MQGGNRSAFRTSRAGATCASGRIILGQNVARQTHYFNSYTSLRFQQNRYGVTHSLNWDVKNQSLTQHRIATYYNAQCCGFSAEYQFIDLSKISNVAVQQDSRFHFSVTLGGIGNVSNIFGVDGRHRQPVIRRHALRRRPPSCSKLSAR